MGKHSNSSGGLFGRKKPGRGVARDHRKLRTIETGPAAKSPGTPRDRVGKKKGSRTGPLEQAPARLKAERDRRRHNYKRIAAISGVSLLAIAAAAIIGGFLFLRSVEGTMQLSNEDKLSISLEKAKPQEPYTVLILGGDRREGQDTYRTDTMMLARVDPRTKQVWMISIPRDTRVEIPDKGASKINSAFVYNGAEGAVDAVNQLLGVPINHYMEVDFEGFSSAVDALGGVWIDVPVAIDDKQAASHSPSASRIDPGYQLLDGDHALTFVRARHQFVDQDFSRMKNQQMFFKALASQAAKTQNIAKLPRVVSSIAPYIRTDMSLVEMIRTAQALRGSGADSIHTATLEGDWRSPFIYPDEEKKAELIEKMMAGVSFEATSVPEATSEAEAGARKPAEIDVAVRNGAGIDGLAKQASSILKAQGFDVGEVGNAKQPVYDKTLVIYKDDKRSAEVVASVLPPGAKVVESRGMYSFETRILVVVGKDWDLAKVPVAPVKTE